MIAAQKASLRSHHLTQRQNISAEEKINLDQLLFESFFKNVTLHNHSRIAGYYPIKGESDVLPILRELIQRDHTCLLPQVTREDFLSFAYWNDKTTMQPGAKFSVPEPIKTTPEVPNVMLVPLVAFDSKKHRLGYGGGYYDRTIAHIKEDHTLLTIGIGYECQKCDTLLTEKTDVRMDMILTEQDVYI